MNVRSAYDYVKGERVMILPSLFSDGCNRTDTPQPFYVQGAASPTSLLVSYRPEGANHPPPLSGYRWDFIVHLQEVAGSWLCRVAELRG